MDLGSYVIVAALCCDLNGELMLFKPSTRFDQQSCMREALQIDKDWHDRGKIGFAACAMLKEPPTP
jgi:hypothetical protein